jgi:xylose isomerase
MLEDGKLEALRAERYAGWDTEDAQALLHHATLEQCEECVIERDIRPEPRSGKQERLENLVNRYL